MVCSFFVLMCSPHDVFRRHDNCGCSVTYEDGGMRQQVWCKRDWSD
ncbi:MAG: hypothetical protein IJ571_05790 [Ruminococcus sp.]|nr:hypothetical protein [Ruminococcus sp.]